MWDQKYRPLRFADVLGQKGPVQVLKARLVKGTGLNTSYIFSGGHGQGKTTLARILARALLCESLGEGGEPCNTCDNCEGVLDETSMAFTELDAASRGTIDNIRGIVDDLPFVVPGAPKRIYLFDEAHRMSRDAQDVLLKPVEDKDMVAVLCTTEPEKIRGTIRSRCEEHSIRKITREDILGRMKWVLDQEGVEYDEDAVMTVIDYSGGHVRDVLNKLEMVSQLGPVSMEAVRENLNLSVVSTYYEILCSLGDTSKVVALVEQACDRVGAQTVSAVLAEAAMNAFRLKHGMFAEFVYLDRELAKRTHEMYGDDVVRLAEYFLRSRSTSKIGLVCDVVRCSGGVPDAQLATGPVAPPVVVQAPQPVKAPEPAQTAPAPKTVPEAAPAEKTPQRAPEAPPDAHKKPQEAPKPNGANGRADGVGGLKSDDPFALTDDDGSAVPEEMPRMRSQRAKSPPKGVVKQKPSEIIPTTQWRREFADAWTQRGTGA